MDENSKAAAGLAIGGAAVASAVAAELVTGVALFVAPILAVGWLVGRVVGSDNPGEMIQDAIRSRRETFQAPKPPNKAEQREHEAA